MLILSKPKPRWSGNIVSVEDTIDNLLDLSRMNFLGQKIVPAVYAKVKNESDKIIGYIMEYFPFPSINHFRLQGPTGLSIFRDQIDQLNRLIGDQLELLHSNGFVHGDISDGNVLLKIRDGKIIGVQLIDFIDVKDRGRKDFEEEDHNQLRRLIYSLKYEVGALP